MFSWESTGYATSHERGHGFPTLGAGRQYRRYTQITGIIPNQFDEPENLVHSQSQQEMFLGQYSVYDNSMTFHILYKNYGVYQDANWIVRIYKKIDGSSKMNWTTKWGTASEILIHSGPSQRRKESQSLNIHAGQSSELLLAISSHLCSSRVDFFTCLLIATHPSGNGSPALSTRHTNHVSPKSLLTGGEDEIVDQVNHEMALKRGEIEEIESDDEEEDEQEEDIGIGELRSLCEKVERLSLKYGDSETCLDLSRSLRQFRIQLRRVETAKARQTSLNEWFSSRESH
ncbi:uncharacterized protein LACBIDRAFT_328997 [Laccaria bicolor S238N-H82]|uniref:Predicted protein n=1 Tax=Laccaria bicolor (strain S238N-H82 / ATCC MYA-4686) TaxID=486041 RepID=B0DGQ5_LACBS|nr:uncharacterized protein LACBIDRAFT_328997 [Laccaria bicolor S238N-H82]EDR06312.1 predicted protein [Laccaria bicolor S238N-H82]|eukprot:XP_001883173.1 predicted protein [Laccaria bicolor S238N-H82]